MLSKAINITAQAFVDKLDKGGHPYILHCIAVMNAMPRHDQELKCIAMMHDLVEDCEEWSLTRLVLEKFTPRVINALKLLTHDRDVPYDDYISALAHSEDARIVKMADLRHNSDIMRMKGLRKKDFDRLEKYHRAYMYLSE